MAVRSRPSNMDVLYMDYVTRACRIQHSLQCGITVQISYKLNGTRVCFRVTTQMYSTIRVYALGLSTHTLLHAWLELRVAVTIQFFIRT